VYEYVSEELEKIDGSRREKELLAYVAAIARHRWPAPPLLLRFDTAFVLSCPDTQAFLEDPE
jgi:hypothetical protein